MEKYSFCAHTSKFIIALTTAVASAFFAVLMLTLREYVGTLLFLLIAVLFAAVSVLYGTTVTLDKAGVSRSFGPFHKKELFWNDIVEVGVVGVKIFNNNDPKHTGSRYIYFSLHPLDEAARFKLAMEWPPRKMLYMAYSKKRMQAVQFLWNRPIESYNAGDIFF